MKTNKHNILLICMLNLFFMNLITAQTKLDSIQTVQQALKLIALPEPTFNSPFIPTPSAKDIEDLGFKQPNKFESIQFKMKDGVYISANKYPYKSDRSVILLHGVLANSYTYNIMSGLLRESLKATVISIDLRGHGKSGGKVGDISQPNQYAEDLNTIITSVREQNNSQSIILAGHSMGGGIVLKHAETFPATKIDAYLLFAPNLGPSTVTTSKKLDLKNNFIKSHLSRGLGLKMLNEYGIHKHDSLMVVFYNLPKEMPITSYSYRSMEAIYPKNLNGTINSIKKPILTLVGGNDEVFIAKAYTTIFKTKENSNCFIIENETHNGIRHNSNAMKKVEEWAIKNKI